MKLFSKYVVQLIYSNRGAIFKTTVLTEDESQAVEIFNEFCQTEGKGTLVQLWDKDANGQRKIIKSFKAAC